MIRRYLDWAHPWTNYYNAPFVGDNAPLVSSRSGGHRRRLVASAANRSGAAALEFRRRLADTIDVCFLDYARVVVLGLWRGASPATMQANARKQGFSMVNRSPRHLEWIARRAARRLARLPALPPPRKTLVLIRHAEAAHNRCFAAAKDAAAADGAAVPVCMGVAQRIMPDGHG